MLIEFLALYRSKSFTHVHARKLRGLVKYFNDDVYFHFRRSKYYYYDLILNRKCNLLGVPCS